MVVCDVTKLADQQRAVATAVSEFGKIDAMIANAGIEGAVAPLVAQSQDDFDKVLAVNVFGVWNSIRAAAAEGRADTRPMTSSAAT